MLRHVLLTTVALAVAMPALAQGVPANSPFSVESAEDAANRPMVIKRNKELLAAEKRKAAEARKAAAEKKRRAAEKARQAEEERMQEMSQPEPTVQPVTPSAAPEAPVTGAAPVEPMGNDAVAPVAPIEPMSAPDAAAGDVPAAPVVPEAASPALEPIMPSEEE